MSLFRGDALALPGGALWFRPRLMLRAPEPGVLGAGAAALAPIVMWLHWATGYGARWAHWAGIPIYILPTAYIAWPELLFWATGLGALACWFASGRPLARDPWLAGAILVLAVARFVQGPVVDPDAVVMVVLGGAIYLLMRSASAPTRSVALKAISAAGLLQASLMLQQAGGVDIQNGILYSSTPLRILGSFGNPGLAAIFVAVTTLVGPWWFLPIAGAAIWISHSMAALFAFGLGVAIRYRTRLARYAAWVILFVAALTVSDRMSDDRVNSAALRLDVWGLAAMDWTSAMQPLLGHGLGNWSRRVPDLQNETGRGFDVYDPGRPSANCCWWDRAHNDPLQWIWETGLAGLVVLVGWLVTNRRMFLHATCGGAVAALAVVSLAWFPFHTWALALPALVLLGCATAAPTSSEVI